MKPKKRESDNRESLEFAVQKGRKEGITEGEKKEKREKREIAKQMLAKEMNGKLIEEATGLTAEEIARLESV